MTLRQDNKELYWAWKSLKQRCMNPKCRAYKNYGGRGIGVCDEWMEFEPFLEWALSSGYQKGLELDRTDNSLGYSPDNCRWITRRENLNNRRVTVMLTVYGETKPKTVWAETIGCDRAMITYWIHQHGKAYAESRIADALDNGYKKNNFGFDPEGYVVRDVSAPRRSA